jgi:hypothetical protein
VLKLLGGAARVTEGLLEPARIRADLDKQRAEVRGQRINVSLYSIAIMETGCPSAGHGKTPRV